MCRIEFVGAKTAIAYLGAIAVFLEVFWYQGESNTFDGVALNAKIGCLAIPRQVWANHNFKWGFVDDSD